MPTADCTLPTANSLLSVANCPLPTAYCLLRSAYCLTGTLVAVVSCETRKVTSVPAGITMYLPFLEKVRAGTVRTPVAWSLACVPWAAGLGATLYFVPSGVEMESATSSISPFSLSLLLALACPGLPTNVI